MDLSFLPSRLIIEKVQALKFQSLFLWIFRSYTDRFGSIIHVGDSFNPCSYGSFVLTDENDNPFN